MEMSNNFFFTLDEIRHWCDEQRIWGKKFFCLFCPKKYLVQKKSCFLENFFYSIKRTFIFGKHSLDRISLDLFSWSKFSVKFGVWSKLFFFTWSNFTWSFQLIESFFNVILSYFKLSINCQKRTYGFWQLIKSFLKPKIPLLELSINCQNPKVLFWQLIECTVG
jgi:hypothetical protein